MKERVVFEANVPVTATLAYADGLKVQGRFGDQVMYSLTDGRVMYVPPMVRDKLVGLGSRQNEPTFADVMNGFSLDAGRKPRRRRWGRSAAPEPEPQPAAV